VAGTSWFVSNDGAGESPRRGELKARLCPTGCSGRRPRPGSSRPGRATQAQGATDLGPLIPPPRHRTSQAARHARRPPSHGQPRSVGTRAGRSPGHSRRSTSGARRRTLGRCGGCSSSCCCRAALVSRSTRLHRRSLRRRISPCVARPGPMWRVLHVRGIRGIARARSLRSLERQPLWRWGTCLGLLPAFPRHVWLRVGVRRGAGAAVSHVRRRVRRRQWLRPTRRAVRELRGDRDHRRWRLGGGPTSPAVATSMGPGCSPWRPMQGCPATDGRDTVTTGCGTHLPWTTTPSGRSSKPQMATR
jgi:hypothetical protein